MKFEEYQKSASRTLADLCPAEMTTHALLGMSSELEEIREISIKADVLHDKEALIHCLKEVGDFMWFTAELCTGENMNLETVVSISESSFETYYGFEENVNAIQRYVSKLHGMYQKTYQGHEIDKVAVAITVSKIIHVITLFCSLYLKLNKADVDDVSIEKVMDMNIEKLKARYPKGFEVEKSLHRKEGDI